jgi:hypothetical protein
MTAGNAVNSFEIPDAGRRASGRCLRCGFESDRPVQRASLLSWLPTPL